ncbi:trypsin-1-like [Anthonomus grandis grandis]|uniref:trypsin-1-like n=1 Tax=Anthonomus grandis grandis TaxID=2921223 RepID=UPI0021661D89|nr:trypsin-1-like [Anthonomus grandis grandis]
MFNTLKIIIFTLMVFNAESITNFADIDCGQTLNERNAKIVGGEHAVEAEFPWLVSITRRGTHFCGGTLISNRYVMTAAHCLCTGSGNDQISPSSIKVTISQHDLTNKNSNAFQIGIKSLKVHPEYSCNKVKNDIAILELEKIVAWTESVTPACLPDNYEKAYSNFQNEFATVAGWGWTNEERGGGGRATILQKAKVQVIETEKCRTWYKSQGKKTKITESQICAGHEQGGVDACWADSGGPLMVHTDSKNQMMVVGVVSTGIGCARPYLPGIYTRVSEFIPWIKASLES